MRVFVSGEHGLLPYSVTERLRSDGVTILNDLMPGEDKTWRSPHDILRAVGALNAPYEFEVNVLSRNIIERIIDLKPDLIIHAAAMVGTDKCILDERLAWKCNVETTFNMAWAARRAKARLVYFSSSAVYDPDAPRPYGVAQDVTHHPRPRTIYGQTKYLGEHVCRQVYGGDGLLVVRPSFVYGGIRDTSSTFVRVAKAVIFDAPPVDVLLDSFFRKDFMHVSDFAGIMRGLITWKAEGTLDISRGYPRFFGNVLTILDDLLGRDAVRAKMLWRPEGDYMGDHYASGEVTWKIAEYVPTIDIEDGIPQVVSELQSVQDGWAVDRGG